MSKSPVSEELEAPSFSEERSMKSLPWYLLLGLILSPWAW